MFHVEFDWLSLVLMRIKYRQGKKVNTYVNSARVNVNSAHKYLMNIVRADDLSVS